MPDPVANEQQSTKRSEELEDRGWESEERGLATLQTLVLLHRGRPHCLDSEIA